MTTETEESQKRLAEEVALRRLTQAVNDAIADLDAVGDPVGRR